jgi:ribosomal-protein-alanine N-acetyltransferase
MSIEEQNKPPILATPKLTIRPLTLDDERGVFALRSDAEINKYLDRQASKTIEDAREFINKVTTNNLLYWAITLTDSQSFAGTICLFDFSEGEKKCEIGYELLPKFQGQGIMREAAGKVIDFAFQILQVRRLEAFSHKDNRSSNALLEKLGFQRSTEPEDAATGLVCFYKSKE